MAEPQAQTFELAKESCKIMRRSFPANVQERIGAKVSWKDFRSALQTLGLNIKSLSSASGSMDRRPSRLFKGDA